jgi:acetyl esterase
MKLLSYYRFVLFAILLPALHAAAQSHKFELVRDVVWASPKGLDLTMDIYIPQTGKRNYPVLLIYHGGGWLINDKSIMSAMAEYVATNGEYVVCNVNYRLLTAANNTTTMNQIIEDALGAVLWVKQNIKNYKGDGTRIAVTGDSAGGHLAAMVANSGNKLETDGFAGSTLGYTPTFIPRGATIRQLVQNNRCAVQAVVLSYPATDIYGLCIGPSGDGSNGFESPSNFFWNMGNANARGIFGDSINVKSHVEYYKAVSPLYTIPDAAVRKLPPHFCAVGSKDDLTTPLLVKEYTEALKSAGHHVTYWEYEGRPHAYLDTGTNQYLGTSFEKDAPPAINEILKFLNGVFYSGKRMNN